MICGSTILSLKDFVYIFVKSECNTWLQCAIYAQRNENNTDRTDTRIGKKRHNLEFYCPPEFESLTNVVGIESRS